MASQDDTPSTSIRIAPDQVQVLYAGNLADDDFLWIVRCSADEYVRLIQSPVAWVAALAELPGWRFAGSDQPAPPAVLLRDFTMVVREGSTRDPDGWVLVQGIGETNQLTVTASREAAVRAAELALGQPSGDPLQAFWNEISADPSNPPTLRKPYAVTIVRRLGRYYGHFEILSGAERLSIGALRTAAYLLGASVDREGHAKMLSGLDQTTLYADGGEVLPGTRIEIRPAGPGSSIVYASAGDTGEGTLVEETDAVCGVSDGETDPPPPPPTGPVDPVPDPTSGTPGTTTVKLYRTPPPPGE